MDGSHLLNMNVQGINDALLSFQSYLELFCVGFLERILSVMVTSQHLEKTDALSYMPKLDLTVGMESI